jgi:hypothetical protein
MQPATLSLTPRFNGVKAAGKTQDNRFNGFRQPAPRHITSTYI